MQDIRPEDAFQSREFDKRRDSIESQDKKWKLSNVINTRLLILLVGLRFEAIFTHDVNGGSEHTAHHTQPAKLLIVQAASMT